METKRALLRLPESLLLLVQMKTDVYNNEKMDIVKTPVATTMLSILKSFTYVISVTADDESIV